MPKIISDIRNKILTSAKVQLKEKGYAGLSLRGVAEDCAIAVGTTYNYFNSKEELVNAIITSDWEEAMKDLDQADPETEDLEEAFRNIYQAIYNFYENYGGISILRRHQSVRIDLLDKHYDDFAKDLTKRLKSIVRKYGIHESESFLRLIAETTITSASHDIDEYDYAELIHRILTASYEK